MGSMGKTAPQLLEHRGYYQSYLRCSHVPSLGMLRERKHLIACDPPGTSKQYLFMAFLSCLGKGINPFLSLSPSVVSRLGDSRFQRRSSLLFALQLEDKTGGRVGLFWQAWNQPELVCKGSCMSPTWERHETHLLLVLPQGVGHSVSRPVRTCGESDG